MFTCALLKITFTKYDIQIHSNKCTFFPGDTILTFKQKWVRATSKVAPLPLALLTLKSSVATATRYLSSKVARYRYFITKVAALPATLNNA